MQDDGANAAPCWTDRTCSPAHQPPTCKLPGPRPPPASSLHCPSPSSANLSAPSSVPLPFTSVFLSLAQLPPPHLPGAWAPGASPTLLVHGSGGIWMFCGPPPPTSSLSLPSKLNVPLRRPPRSGLCSCCPLSRTPCGLLFLYPPRLLSKSPPHPRGPRELWVSGNTVSKRANPQQWLWRGIEAGGGSLGFLRPWSPSLCWLEARLLLYFQEVWPGTWSSLKYFPPPSLLSPTHFN